MLTKTSLLRIKPSLSKISPEKLGYILPDGRINFSTKHVAWNYAKNKVTAALNGTEPFERTIIIKDNQIIGEIDGNRNCVNLDPFKSELSNATVIHGHSTHKVEGDESPFGIEDFLVMLATKIKRSFAITKDGRISGFVQKNPHKEEKVLDKIANFVIYNQANSYAQLLPKKFQKIMRLLIYKNVDKNLGCNFLTNKKIEFKNREEIDEINNCLSQINADTKVIAQKANKCWIEIEDKLDAKYISTY